MSVRAYKINHIDTQGSPTFNLWHDKMIMDLLRDEIYSRLNDDGCGLTELSETAIKDAIKELKEDKENIIKRYIELENTTKEDAEEEYQNTKETLNNMLKEAKEMDGYVQYYCF